MTGWQRVQAQPPTLRLAQVLASALQTLMLPRVWEVRERVQAAQLLHGHSHTLHASSTPTAGAQVGRSMGTGQAQLRTLQACGQVQV